MIFYMIFGTLRAHIQKPFRWLTDRHTDRRKDVNRKGCRAHVKHRKGPQGAYEMLKRTTGRCALLKKPRISTILQNTDPHSIYIWNEWITIISKYKWKTRWGRECGNKKNHKIYEKSQAENKNWDWKTLLNNQNLTSIW